MEEALLESERIRVLAETAGAAAHEINQPLMVIMGLVQLLQKQQRGAVPPPSDLETIYKQAERIEEIVKKMGAARQYAATDYVGETRIIDFDEASKVEDEEEPPPDEEKPRHLHVEMKGEDVFQLQWKEGQDVVGSAEVPREKITGEKGAVSFPALGKKIKEEWAANGTHKGVSDLRRDQAVLHTDNSTEFAEIIAVIDAIYVTQRDLKFKEKTELVPAFNVTFAVD